MLSSSLTACTPGGENNETASTDSAVITDTQPEVTAGEAKETETDEATETETEADYDDPAIKPGYLTVGGIDISEYTVVIPESPGKYDQIAADFLVRFIGEATGVTVRQTTDAESADHMILVGTTAYDIEEVRTARSEIRNDGYVMLTDGGNLYITGALDRGTLFGVYDFLEKYLGVRMYGGVTYPEKQEMYEIKQNLRVDIPADLYSVYSSPVAYRRTSWTAVNDGWAYFPFWDCYNSSEFKYTASGMCHTIAHFAETGGDLSPNPCLTDENIYRTVLKNVRRELENKPDAQYVNISQTDGTSHGCRCQNCRAVEAEEESPSGPWIRFVNRIADDIKEDYPNVMVETLAYAFTEKPPKITKPAENVAVCLCTISCCFAHAINDPDCPQNVTFTNYVKGWSEICDNLKIWTYSGNFHGIDNGDKNFAPNFRVIRESVKFFIDHNVTGFYVEGQQHPADRVSTVMGELRAYLWGRVLWNPNITEEEFKAYTDDFMNYYYGDAGPLILKYVDTVYGDMLDNTKYNKLMVGHSDAFAEYGRFFRKYDTEGNCTPAYMDKLSAIWDEIYALDTLTDVQKYHVDCAAVQFFDIAHSVYHDIGVITHDAEVKQKVRDYKAKLSGVKKRIGL